MKGLALALLIGLFAAAARAEPGAEPGAVTGVEVSEYGLYTAETIGAVPAPDAAVGSVSWVRHEQLQQKTRTVPGRLGVHFGYRYKVSGAPAGAPARLRAVTIFPPGGIRNPDTGKLFTREFYWLDKTIGEASYRDYAFDYSWEIAPGVWTFEIWCGTQRLSVERFLVVLGPIA